LFLQRLPWEIHVLLADEDSAELSAAADKADKLVAIHSPQSHEVVAATVNVSDSEEEGAAAAAVKSGGRSGSYFQSSVAESATRTALHCGIRHEDNAK
jgi:hypothetical protein